MPVPTAQTDKWLKDALDVDVRPSEIVAGASGVQYSYGENTAQTDEDGGDFAEGSRKNAEANDHSKAYSGYNDGSNPMQSPNLAKPGGFAVRYGIGFLCSKYPKGWNNLEDIAEYSKPNSKFLKAFAGMTKSQQYKNPTKGQVLAEIPKWAGALAKALPPGGQGELVVTFQGHGAHGSFYASDGGEITASQMLNLAKQGEKLRVSTTYVMDACFSGGAVPQFQDHAADFVDKKVDQNVEGKGQVCSEDNHRNAEQLRDQMAHAQELIQFSSTIAQHGDKLNALIQTIEANETTAAWDAAMAENSAIIKLIQAEKVQFGTNMDFGNDPRMQLEKIASAFDTVLSTLNAIKPYTSFDYTQWTGSIGKFQDQISDGGNRIIKLIQQQAS
jgi:predicted GNAT family acetyltransferase